jgi:hypothetical protein
MQNCSLKTLTGRGCLKIKGGKHKLNHMQMLRRDVEWIHLAQDRDKHQALVISVMNFRVLTKSGVFLDKLRHYQDL